LLLILFCLFFPACSRAPSPAKPNLLLISLDTLRADHLGCYGYPLPTSPFIDALSGMKHVVLFERCIAQAPNTAPSHMSLFTSLYPTVHGVPNLAPEAKRSRFHHSRHTRTLAQVLKEAGYDTAGITEGGYLNPVFGFEQGFDTYECSYAGIKRKVDQAIAWLEERRRSNTPFFLFLHTYEVHAPYLPPEPFRTRFTGDYEGWIKSHCFGEEATDRNRLDGFADIFTRRQEFTAEDIRYLTGLYDGEIAYTDQELARLFHTLEAEGLAKDLVVVLLSDHGEEFGEHGEFSHKQLYDEVVHVPLLIGLPHDAPSIKTRRVKAQVSLIDVMPTLLDLLGVEPPAYLQGQSLCPLWQGQAPAAPRPAFSALIDFDPAPLLCAIRRGDRKLLDLLSGQQFELYDLAQDPGESRNVLEAFPKEGKQLFEMLGNWRTDGLKMRERYKAMPVEGQVAPDLYEELKQLGY
jgi:arylsulfatase A-like enzyme